MANKPPSDVTQERERRAWLLRQQCWTERRIAEELGVDISTVSRMLARMRKKLAMAFEEQAAEIKAEQTTQLLHIADEAMQMFERSKLPAETLTTTTGRAHVSRDGEVVGLPDQQVSAVRAQAGDTGALRAAMEALAQIREIWGLNAPKKTDVTSGGQPIKAYGLVDPNDL